MIIIQGYITSIKFSIIDKYRKSEISSVNETFKGMKLIKIQNLRTLRYWLQYQDKGNIYTSLLADDIIES